MRPQAQAEFKKNFLFTVDGTNVTWTETVDQDGNPSTFKGELKLDPTKTPKQFEIKKFDGNIRGIYELKGNTLKLCYVVGGESAIPKDFKSTAANEATIFTLTKSKSKSK
jgi:uncharacterized protein (TIGR03067 family)